MSEGKEWVDSELPVNAAANFNDINQILLGGDLFYCSTLIVSHTLGTTESFAKVSDSITISIPDGDNNLDDRKRFVQVGSDLIPVLGNHRYDQNSSKFMEVMRFIPDNGYGIATLVESEHFDVDDDNPHIYGAPVNPDYTLVLFRIFNSRADYVITGDLSAHAGLTGDRKNLHTPDFKDFPGYIIALSREHTDSTEKPLPATCIHVLALVKNGETFIMHNDIFTFYQGLYNTPLYTRDGRKALQFPLPLDYEISASTVSIKPPAEDIPVENVTVFDVIGENNGETVAEVIRVDNSGALTRQTMSLTNNKNVVLGDGGIHCFFNDRVLINKKFFERISDGKNGGFPMISTGGSGR